jgi:hypothetical protein
MEALVAILSVVLWFTVAVAAMAALFLSLYLPIRWVLGPLDRAAKNRRYPIQFSLADFLCLFVQIQLLLAWPALAFRESQDKTAMACVTVLVVGLVLLIWWTGVHTLSRAGVHGTFGRAFTLTVSIPFGYAFSIAIPMLPFVIFALFQERHEPIVGLAGVLSLIEVAVIVLVVVLGFVTRRILATALQEEEPMLDESEPLVLTIVQESPPHSET